MVDGFDEDTTADNITPPMPLLGREDISILVLSGPSAGQYRKLPRDGGIIGREADVDFPINDPGVSRRHALIAREDTNAFVIRDLESRYGLYVEGEKVERHMLSDGDRIQMSGETVIRVRYQDPKETEILDNLHEAVIRDSLTGVANRRYFLERLEQEFGYARRHNAPLTILMIDVDHFKRVNDARGHPTGDQVLRAVGRALHGAVRVEDVVARYGGDEFMVLSRGYDTSEGERFAARLLKTVREKAIRVGQDQFSVTVSVGVATYHRGEPESLMQLIARADAALYQAKLRGRDQCAVWKSEEKAAPLPPSA
jgi:diguanylate cyclase (GGDEF)-like protein